MLKPGAALLVTGLVLGGCSGGAPDKPSVRLASAGPVPISGAPYLAGKRHLAAGELGLAIDAFRQAVRADPQSVDALNGLATAYDRIGRFDLSRRYYEMALGLAPDAAIVLNNLGYSLALQGRPDEARALLERASQDPATRAVSTANLARLSPAAPGAAPQAPPATTTSSGAGATPTPARALPSSQVAGWVERTDALHQMLVTRPRAELVAVAAALRLEPRLISAVQHRPIDPPAVRSTAVTTSGRSAARSTVAAATSDRSPARSIAIGASGYPPAVLSIATGASSHPPAVLSIATGTIGALLASGEVFAGSAAARTLRVVVLNGSGRNYLAGRVGAFLASRGVAVARMANAPRFGWQQSEIRHAPSDRAAAMLLAASLPFRPQMREVGRAAGIELILGHDALLFERRVTTRPQRS